MDEPIGSIPIIVSGDYSKLTEDLSTAQGIAAAGAEKIADSFTSAAGSASTFDERIQSLIDGGNTLAEALARVAEQDVTPTLSNAGQAASSAAQQIGSVAPAAQEAATETSNWQKALGSLTAPLSEAETGSQSLVEELLKFGGIALTLQGVKTAVEEAFGAFARVERATESLTALTGSSEQAEQSIEALKRMAMDDALSFPALFKADQAMTAFGFDTKEIPALLQAAADAARATGKDFDTTSASIERMAAAGMVGGRQLSQLGLTTTDLADVMSVSEKQVAKLFKALDQSDRIEVIIDALQKFKGVAQATAGDLTGSWQNLKNTAEEAFEGIGAQLAPLGQQFVTFASGEVQEIGSVLTSIASVGKAFSDLPDVVSNAFVAIAMLKFTNPMAALGIELVQLGLAWKGLQDAEEDATRATKQADDSFAGIAVREHQMFADFPDYTAKFNALLDSMNQGEITHEQYQQKVRDLNTEFRALNPLVQTATDTHKSFLDQVNLLGSKLAAGTITQGQYDAAMKNLISSTEGLTTKTKTHVLSLDDLIAKNATLNTALALAQAVYDQVTARVHAGSGEYNLQSEALKQLTRAHKDLGDSEMNTNLITGTLEEKTQDTVNKLFAEADVVDNLTAKWGADDAVTQAAMKTRDGLLAQLGLTRTQFDLLRATLDAAGIAHQTLAGHITETQAAFKDLGITSSAALDDMANKARTDYQSISDSAGSSAGDIRKAQETMIADNQRYRDSITPIADDYKTLGITSSQALLDLRDKGQRAFNDLSMYGTQSAGDISKAIDKLVQENRDYIDSLSGVSDAFKQLGLTSSQTLQRQAQDAETAYNRISASGTASAGDISRAADAMRAAQQKYLDSLSPIPTKETEIGTAAHNAAGVVSTAATTMIQSISGVYIAANNLGQILPSVGNAGVAAFNAMDQAVKQTLADLNAVGGATSSLLSGTMAESWGGQGPGAGSAPVTLPAHTHLDYSGYGTRGITVAPDEGYYWDPSAPFQTSVIEADWHKLAMGGTVGGGATSGGTAPSTGTPVTSGSTSGGTVSMGLQSTAGTGVLGVLSGALDNVQSGIGDVGTAAQDASTPLTQLASAFVTVADAATVAAAGAVAGMATIPGITPAAAPTAAGTPGSMANLPAALTPTVAPTAITPASFGQTAPAAPSAGTLATGYSGPMPTGWTAAQWAAYQSGGAAGLSNLWTSAPPTTPTVTPQMASTTGMTWLGGMGPGVASAPVSTASGTGAMSLAELQAALGITSAAPTAAATATGSTQANMLAEAGISSVPAGMSAQDAINQANAAKEQAAAAAASADIGAAPTLPSSTVDLTSSLSAGVDSSSLGQTIMLASDNEVSVLREILAALQSWTGAGSLPSTAAAPVAPIAPAVGNTYSGYIGTAPTAPTVHVTINNPTVTNQSQLDQMVQQIQNVGLTFQ